VVTQRKIERLEWIDVLRAIAALGVAIFHSMPALWVGMYRSRPGSLSRFDHLVSYLSIPAHFGYAGVMLFFLVSGFVIHLPNAYGGSFDARSYFARRFGRIYPPYAAALALSVAVWLVLPQVTNAHGGWIEVVKAIFMVQNYPHFGFDLPSQQPVANFALWSLPVELELYIVYPILLLWARRSSFNRVSWVVVAISIAATVLQVGVRPGQTHLATIVAWVPTFAHYLVVWCAGAWLAQRVVDARIPKWNIGWSAIFAVSIVCSLLGREKLRLPVMIDDFLWATTFFCLMLWILNDFRRRDWFDRRELAPLRYIGKVSYSLYLIHLPVFIVIAGTVFARSNYETTNFLYCILATLIALLVAAVFYNFVEAPSAAL